MPRELATDLVSEFLTIRQDLAMGVLGKAAPGKFVETFVQILQHMETGTFDQSPKVDDYLRGLESRAAVLIDDLRICAARVARAMYTLRNKRNILHKGQVDSNRYDLEFLHAGAQWTVAELLRNASGVSMEAAGHLIAQVLAPVGALVEDFGTHALVLADVSVTSEILLIFRTTYPSAKKSSDVTQSLSRRHPQSVRNALNRLWKEKLLERRDGSFILTTKGLDKAAEIAAQSIPGGS